MEKDDGLIDFGPRAAYPGTSASEQQSKSTLEYLLDSNSLVPQLRVMDKYPGVDGWIEVLDQQNRAIGKIEVQMKTLEPKNYHAPKYQCDKPFLALCADNDLPVILIAVDGENNLAYWLHMDRVLLQQLSETLTKQSVSVTIPKINIISRTDLKYIADWTNIIEAGKKQRRQYPLLLKENSALSLQLGELQKFSSFLLRIDPQKILVLNEFIDHYNYIWDYEFKKIKDLNYPGYWKFGLGITEFSHQNVCFVIIPQSHTANEPLLRHLDSGPKWDILEHFLNYNALILTCYDFAQLGETPKQIGYHLVKNFIMRTVSKSYFGISDIEAANEYLYAFIKKFEYVLDRTETGSGYAIAGISMLLSDILPIIVSKQLNFGDKVTAHDYSLESFDRRLDSGIFSGKIQLATDDFKNRIVSDVQVTIKSSGFDLDLVGFYLNFLTGRAVEFVNQRLQRISAAQYPTHDFANWDLDALLLNLKIVLPKYHTCYKLNLIENFPKLLSRLEIQTGFNVTVYVLDCSRPAKKPLLMVYNLLADRMPDQNVFVYLKEDPACFIDEQRLTLDYDFTFGANGYSYRGINRGVKNLDFLFEEMPINELVKKTFNEKIEWFFNSVKSQ